MTLELRTSDFSLNPSPFENLFPLNKGGAGGCPVLGSFHSYLFSAYCILPSATCVPIRTRGDPRGVHFALCGFLRQYLLLAFSFGFIRVYLRSFAAH